MDMPNEMMEAFRRMRDKMYAEIGTITSTFSAGKLKKSGTNVHKFLRKSREKSRKFRRANSKLFGQFLGKGEGGSFLIESWTLPEYSSYGPVWCPTNSAWYDALASAESYTSARANALVLNDLHGFIESTCADSAQQQALYNFCTMLPHKYGFKTAWEALKVADHPSRAKTTAVLMHNTVTQERIYLLYDKTVMTPAEWVDNPPAQISTSPDPDILVHTPIPSRMIGYNEDQLHYCRNQLELVRRDTVTGLKFAATYRLITPGASLPDNVALQGIVERMRAALAHRIQLVHESFARGQYNAHYTYRTETQRQTAIYRWESRTQETPNTLRSHLVYDTETDRVEIRVGAPSSSVVPGWGQSLDRSMVAASEYMRLQELTYPRWEDSTPQPRIRYFDDEI